MITILNVFKESQVLEIYRGLSRRQCSVKVHSPAAYRVPTQCQRAETLKVETSSQQNCPIWAHSTHAKDINIVYLSGKLAPGTPWTLEGSLWRYCRSSPPPAAGRVRRGPGSPPAGSPVRHLGSDCPPKRWLRPPRPRSDPAVAMEVVWMCGGWCAGCWSPGGALTWGIRGSLLAQRYPPSSVRNWSEFSLKQVFWMSFASFMEYLFMVNSVVAWNKSDDIQLYS